MSKNRSQKEQEVTTLVERLGRAKSVIFSSYQGLKVSESTALRKTMREEGVTYQVVKKTLLEKALADAGMPALAVGKLESGLALAFGFEDEVLPAKLLDVFKKDHQAVAFQGGIIAGQQYSAAQILSLAKLPSRPELIGKVLGSLQSPISSMCRVAVGPMRGLVQVLNAHVEKSAA